MWLPASILADTRALKVRVFYVSYAATRVWAAERPAGEPLIFSGWYWAHDLQESGPYKSQSAAWRDAWYRLARRRPPPVVGKQNDLFERERQTAANKARKRRALP